MSKCFKSKEYRKGSIICKNCRLYDKCGKEVSNVARRNIKDNQQR